jgi:hypothetical protein
MDMKFKALRREFQTLELSLMKQKPEGEKSKGFDKVSQNLTHKVNACKKDIDSINEQINVSINNHS